MIQYRELHKDEWADYAENMLICTQETPFIRDFGEQALQHYRKDPLTGRFVRELEEEQKAWMEKFEGSLRNYLTGAFDGGTLIGTATIQEADGQCALGINIRQAYWGQGIGTALMTRCLAFAGKAGYQTVFLHVMTENVRGLRLYRKLGFLPTPGAAEEVFRAGKVYHLMKMQLDLHPQ